MTEQGADTVVILSSELIAKITEEYFNKTMFKQKVEIVDLKPTETGYMFSVAFVVRGKTIKGEVVSIPSYATASLGASHVRRASNGKFIRKVEVSNE